MDSFVGRLGVSLGKDIERGNVYVRASYLYDFDGDAKMHMNYGDISTPFSEDLGGGWWEFGVGTNLNLVLIWDMIPTSTPTWKRPPVAM